MPDKLRGHVAPWLSEAPNSQTVNLALWRIGNRLIRFLTRVGRETKTYNIVCMRLYACTCIHIPIIDMYKVYVRYLFYHESISKYDIGIGIYIAPSVSM